MNVDLTSVQVFPSAELPDEAVSSGLLLEELRDVFSSLDGRAQTVIEMRYGLHDGEPKTLADVAKVLGVSRTRVRQIEFGTLRRMQAMARERKGFLQEFREEVIEETRRAEAENERRMDAEKKRAALQHQRAVEALNRLPRVDGAFVCTASSVWREGVPVPVRHVDSALSGEVWTCPHCALRWPSEAAGRAEARWLLWIIGTDSDRARLRAIGFDPNDSKQTELRMTPCSYKEGHSK